MVVARHARITVKSISGAAHPNMIPQFKDPHGSKPFETCSRKHFRRPGFALVVTLSLMILLTVVAVGLLTLSSISLRSVSGESAMSEARASARLAMMLAIGDLQKEMGPDTRISTAADQLAGSGSTPQTNPRAWTAVYDAWTTPANPADPDSRPSPAFRRWLVSGTDAQQKALATASSSLTAANSVELVGKGTLGAATTTGLVAVPFLNQKTGTATTGRLAWWVGDQGVKAAISTPQPEVPGTDRRLVRNGLQGAPRNAVQLAKTTALEPFKNLAADDARLQLVTDWKQAGFLSDTAQGPQPLFHDLASNTNGLLTNVRSGGFRKDLSMYLESNAPPASFPPPLVGSNGALYQVNGQDGIRIGELWSYYNLYKQLQTSSITFTTGGTASGAVNPHLKAAANMAAAQADNFFYFKRPVIISFKALFSFYVDDTATPRQLAFVVDPVVTFWNPYDVPISLSPAFNSIRFLKIPYQINGLSVTAGGITKQVGNVNLGGKGSSNFASTTDYNYVTLRAGKDTPIVLRPGEVLVYAQKANTAPRLGDVVNNSNTIDGKAGYSFGGGIYYRMKDSAGVPVTIPQTTGNTQQVDVNFSSITPNQETIIQNVSGAASVSVNHCETYFFEDRKALGSSLGIGGAFVDFWKGLPPHTAVKPGRFTADQKTNIFKSFPAGTVTMDALGPINDRKKPFLYYSYDAKTEEDSLRGGQFLSRLNPSAPTVDFADLTDAELDTLPFEIHIESNTSSALNSVIDQDPANGRGYFGGGTTGTNGSTFISTHSVPREPLVSLAALQHSMANGFNRIKPDTTGAAYGLNPEDPYSNQSIRMPMLPQIAHAVGNSLAPSVLEKNQTEGSLSGGRALADHSYLANKALWDDWFFSGIAPQSSPVNPTGASQKNTASNFLNGTRKLPVARFTPELGSQTATEAVNRLFSGNNPRPEAMDLVATLLRVEGMFNINSTSVEAWKAVLAGLKDHPVIVRDDRGRESIAPNAGSSPVAGLLVPTTNDSNGGNVDVKDLAQWTGRRTLTDVQIEELAKALVEEVRKRGPFLSLADFINRRPGSDEALARAGAVQSAIDAAKLNDGFDSRMASASSSLKFPAAESGSPAAQGVPGIIKQADILTPIAPILSARSDSFIIRSYGEKRDSSGTRVLARAWCEAVVERDHHFVDPSDPPETPIASLKQINQTFGRRFVIRSFRWLTPGEI